MEETEEADLGAKVAGIAGNLQQRFRASLKQQVVDQPLVLQCQRCELPRQRENDMDIAGGQQFLFTGLEPANTSVALTSWAMPVSARVVRDGGMSAVRALIKMSTQRSGTAARDGQQHPLVLPVDPLATALQKRLPGTTNDVGHLQRRSTHALCVCFSGPWIVSASRGLLVAPR